MTMVMDMLKIRIRFFKELINHTYFFERPDYSSELSKKCAKKLKSSPELKVEILEDLKRILGDQKAINADSVNKICSLYLYENRDRQLKNEDVFFLLRYALSGNPVGGPTGEIAEVIGLEEVLGRIDDCI